ncbi:hypothetical protein ACFX1S_039277 [Malus domestica]
MAGFCLCKWIRSYCISISGDYCSYSWKAGYGEAQVVNKYRLPDGSITAPMDLAYTTVDDRLYVLGGKWFEGSNWNGKSTGKQQ